MNVSVDHDFDMLADRIALNMESCNIPAVLFDQPGRRYRNVILVGGVVEHIQISSSRKPICVRQGLRGIVRRAPKTHL